MQVCARHRGLAYTEGPASSCHAGVCARACHAGTEDATCGCHAGVCVRDGRTGTPRMQPSNAVQVRVPAARRSEGQEGPRSRTGAPDPEPDPYRCVSNPTAPRGAEAARHTHMHTQRGAASRAAAKCCQIKLSPGSPERNADGPRRGEQAGRAELHQKLCRPGLQSDSLGVCACTEATTSGCRAGVHACQRTPHALRIQPLAAM